MPTAPPAPFPLVQPLLNNRAALLALLTLPAKFANLTVRGAVMWGRGSLADAGRA